MRRSRCSEERKTTGGVKLSNGEEEERLTSPDVKTEDPFPFSDDPLPPSKHAVARNPPPNLLATKKITYSLICRF